MNQSDAIISYTEQVAILDKDDYAELWDAAERYNADLYNSSSYILTEEQSKEYHELLNIDGNGIMGYIEIKKIDLSLPIYHGTDESVLQVAVGHLDWTSLPVGGESTHTVLSGHRGLPSAKLFTDLDQLEVGDTFVLRVLGEELTYIVDQILVVTPDDTSALQIEEGKDQCTLMTCTPYGINSHRLLVRAQRLKSTSEAVGIDVAADAVLIDPVKSAPIFAVPVLMVFLLKMVFKLVKVKNREEINL